MLPFSRCFVYHPLNNKFINIINIIQEFIYGIKEFIFHQINLSNLILSNLKFKYFTFKINMNSFKYFLARKYIFYCKKISKNIFFNFIEFLPFGRNSFIQEKLVSVVFFLKKLIKINFSQVDKIL